MKHRWMAVLGIALSMSLAGTSVLSAGGGGGGGGGGGASAREARVADPDFQAALAAVKASDWKQVVARMTPYLERNPDSADAWNELGHAHRKMGDLDSAFSAYGRALKIDPKHRGAHEYLGEAYLQAGDLGRAEEELRTLDRLCFLPCEEYTDLKEQVQLYKGKNATTAKR